jgi:hypothetical protein
LAPIDTSETNLVVIMKDGKIYKNLPQWPRRWLPAL